MSRLLVGQALLVSFHVSRQSMQELSSLGRSSIRRSPRSLLLATEFSLFAKRRTRKKEEEVKRKDRKRKGAEKPAGQNGARLLDGELVARSSKKNWKSVALSLDGPKDSRRGGTRREEDLGNIVRPFASSSFSSVYLRPVLSFSFLYSLSLTKRSR